MPPDKYDVIDKWGRRIGTIEPSSSLGGCGGCFAFAGFFIIATLVGIPILLILGCINAVALAIHPVMPHTYFPVQRARTYGPAHPNVGIYSALAMQVYPGGVVAFIFKNEYSAGQFSLKPRWYGSSPALGPNQDVESSVTVNAQKMRVDAVLGSKMDITLVKGMNTIRIINESHGRLLMIEGIQVYDKMCDNYRLFYGLMCGDDQSAQNGHLVGDAPRMSAATAVPHGPATGKSEVCTSYTDTREVITVYAADEGEHQRLRADISSGSQQRHFIVASGITYVWNNWSTDTETFFKNAAVPFRDYFGLQDRLYRPHLECQSWTPDYSEFDLPTNLTFRRPKR
jgi:hypothetical protein